MLVLASGYLLLSTSTLATPLELAAARLPHASSLNSTGATALAASNAFQCFDSPFPPPGPFYPIVYSACIDAADAILANVRADVPLTFSRNDNADVQLPWLARCGNCVMTLNVVNEHDEDIIVVEDARTVALALCRTCVGGYYRYGGRTPVGPRGVVWISVYGTRPGTLKATGPATPQPSNAVATRIEPRSPGLLNTSLPSPTSISRSSVLIDGFSCRASSLPKCIHVCSCK